MKRLAAIILTAVLALAACGGTDAPKEGYVLDKAFREAHLEWVPGIFIPPTCTPMGNYVSCSAGINIPGHFRSVPDRHSLMLRNEGEEGWRNVTQDRWEAAAIGQWSAR